MYLDCETNSSIQDYDNEQVILLWSNTPTSSCFSDLVCFIAYPGHDALANASQSCFFGKGLTAPDNIPSCKSGVVTLTNSLAVEGLKFVKPEKKNWYQANFGITRSSAKILLNPLQETFLRPFIAMYNSEYCCCT